MVESMKAIARLSVGMKMLLGLGEAGAIWLTHYDKIGADQFVTITMALFLIAQRLIGNNTEGNNEKP